MNTIASNLQLGRVSMRTVLESAHGALFDLDGTLLDFEGAAHACLNSALTPAVLNWLGRDEPVTWALHAQIVGQKGTLWSRTILDALEVPSSMLSPAEYLHNWHRDLEEHYPSMTLLPGALETVRFFKERGLPVAIATSSERSGMLMKTSFHPELMRLVDQVVTGDQVVNSKPMPDIFLRAADAIGVPANYCLVFEDAPSGVTAGKSAGATVIAVPDPRFAAWNADKFDNADYVLNSLCELFET